MSVPAPGPGDRGWESHARINTALLPRAGLQAQESPGVGGQAGSRLRVGVCSGWKRPCSTVSNSAPGANQASAGSSRAEAGGFQPAGPGIPVREASHRGTETRWTAVTGLPAPQSPSDQLIRPNTCPQPLFSMKLLFLRLTVDSPVVVKNSPERCCLHFALFFPKATALQNSRTTSPSRRQHYRPPS